MIVEFPKKKHSIVKWGNFFIECDQCGRIRHTGTNRNAEIIKGAHEHNHPGHKCQIVEEPKK